jgi:tRNA A-37 threonylcarbamoyl transferase component Bud32
MAVRRLLVAGRYRLHEPVGTGGMGRVWMARDEMLDRDVAVKEFVPPDWMSDTERDRLRVRTLHEARSAARLNHPHVVRIYDVVHADDLPWIVMEYVASRSLHQVIVEDGPLAPDAVARIGLDILDALTAAHHAGVLHRDVKPHNVLIGHDGRVVLTDFGLATFVDDGTITGPGLIVGSPQYVSPERARDGASTVESDLWSLGATLYSAVEGRSPYGRDSAMATLMALATEPPDPPVLAGPLAPVLTGLLRHDPATRLTPDQIEEGLRQVATGGGAAGGFGAGGNGPGGNGQAGSAPRGRPAPGGPAPLPRAPGHNGIAGRGVIGSAAAGYRVAGRAAVPSPRRAVDEGQAPAGVGPGPSAGASAVADETPANPVQNRVADGWDAQRQAAAEGLREAGAVRRVIDRAAVRPRGRTPDVTPDPAAADPIGTNRAVPDAAAPQAAGIHLASSAAAAQAAQAAQAAPAAAAAASPEAAAPEAAAPEAAAPDRAAHGPAAPEADVQRDRSDIAPLHDAGISPNTPAETMAGASPMVADPKVADPKVADPKVADAETGNPAAGDPETRDSTAEYAQAADSKAGQPKAADPDARASKPSDLRVGDPKIGDHPAVNPTAVDPSTGDPDAAAPNGTTAAPTAATSPAESPRTAPPTPNPTPPSPTPPNRPTADPATAHPAGGRQRAATAPPAPITTAASTRSADSRGRLALAGALLVALLAGGGVAVGWLTDRDGTPGAAPVSSTVPSSPADTSGTAAGAGGFSPSICDRPLGVGSMRTPLPGAFRTGPNGGLALLPGWSYHRDETGFVVAVPDGWTYQRIGTTVCFGDPRGVRVLSIDTGRKPTADPVVACRREAARLASTGALPAYAEVGIKRVPYLAKAADWEYRYSDGQGDRMHAATRWFTSGGRAYALGWVTAEFDWQVNTSNLSMILSSFDSPQVRAVATKTS